MRARLFLCRRAFLFSPQKRTSPPAEAVPAAAPHLFFIFAIHRLYENGDVIMTKIKNPEAYFSTMVRNSYKNEFRANDNFFNHISSVGDESDIQQESTGEERQQEHDTNFIEKRLCEASVENWLLFMENERLHSILSKLPKKDVELLFLLFVVRLRQADIARLCNVSQGAIGYRYKRLKIKILSFLKKAL